MNLLLKLLLTITLPLPGHECMAYAGCDCQRDHGKAQAIQNAERARNELAQTQAEAAKKVAEAGGDAKSAVTRAQGEAEANRIRQTSITPQLLELGGSKTSAS